MEASIRCYRSWSPRSVPILHLASSLLRWIHSDLSMRLWSFRHHLPLRVSARAQMKLLMTSGQTLGLLLRDLGVPSSGIEVVASNCCNSRYADIRYSSSSHGRLSMVELSFVSRFEWVEAARLVFFSEAWGDCWIVVVWPGRNSKLGSRSNDVPAFSGCKCHYFKAWQLNPHRPHRHEFQTIHTVY